MPEKQRGFAFFLFFFPPQTAFSGNFVPSDLVTLPTRVVMALERCCNRVGIDSPGRSRNKRPGTRPVVSPLSSAP